MRHTQQAAGVTATGTSTYAYQNHFWAQAPQHLRTAQHASAFAAEEGNHAAWHRNEQFHIALSKHQTHTRQKSSSTGHGVEEQHPKYHIHFASHAQSPGTHVLVLSRHNMAAGGPGTIGGRRAIASGRSKTHTSYTPHFLPE